MEWRAQCRELVATPIVDRGHYAQLGRQTGRCALTLRLLGSGAYSDIQQAVLHKLN